MLDSGLPQQRASFVRCSSQTPHVASPQSRHLPTRGLRASQHRQNTTGLSENLDPRARWRNVISAARVLSRFENHEGANNHKDKPVDSSDDEDDNRGGGSTSRRATPKTDNNRQQQQLSPSSPDDRVPRRRVAGLVAAGATRPTKTTPPPRPLPPSPMSFSDAIKKAKVAAATTAEADKVRDEGGQQAQATTFQPSKTQHVVPRRDNENGGSAHVASERRAEGEEVEEEVAFEFEDHDSGAARAGTVDPFDGVGMLGNLWRRMQVR